MRTTAFCIICASLLLAAVADGATVQVRSSLQAAIDAASPGDTLLVAPGAYEKIAIQKSLNLVGDRAQISAGSRDACVSIEADGVAISGFVIRDGFYGIKLNNAKGCSIFNNTVIRCAQPGIALLYSDGNTITGNNASFNGLGGEGWYGIYLSNSNNNLIVNNEASNNGAYGINLFPSCNNNTIQGNVMEGNMNGLYMYTDCADNCIEGNRMSRNTNFGLFMLLNCHHNLVLNNTLEDNLVAGITLKDSGHNDLSGNVIHGNGRYGLQILGSSDENRIIDNTVAESRTGIFVESKENQIYSNSISDNAVSADDRSTNSWNAPYPTGGNLWSDYIGKDERQGPAQNSPGEDGFGDTPYRVSQASRDEYPVMGHQVRQISVLEKSLSAQKARAGDSIAVKAKLKSRYAISSVTVRAFRSGVEAEGYARLTPSGDLYAGSFSTALLEPGRYEMVLRARDDRGYEIEETLGEVEVSSRGGFSSP